MGFAKLRKGMRARIVSIASSSEALQRIQEMGLTVGTTFRVVKVAPFGDPVEIDVRGYRLCLRRAETQGIEVEAIS
ncbi:MAG: ferrous iron transport protein [Fimbriimonadaceae bacterium]|jgi:ferrous iron transport protein A|nr:ferrous iron transport protein [Fimbriimonadaceae bacterium]